MVYRLDPLSDPRWDEFAQRHLSASVFHTREWLDALRRTYGYEPAVLTTSGPGQALANGLVFCRVASWLTGRRLVSLPFTDHCEPLVESGEQLGWLLAMLKQELTASRLKYLEIRPVSRFEGVMDGLESAGRFWLHRLNLRSELDEIYRGFHSSCVRRLVRRAERETLTYDEGRSESLLEKFYGLLLLTRQRHRLPPQPLAWFRNLLACMGEKAKIRLASVNGRSIASILTLRHKQTLVYKYGCSDKQFSNLGGMHLLFWEAIKEAKREGLLEFDLGRSDWDNQGLIDFKDRWGATRSELTYYRYTARPSRLHSSDRAMRLARHMFGLFPNRLLRLAGTALYRHIG